MREVRAAELRGCTRTRSSGQCAARGRWCCFEEAVSQELVARSTQPGFEEVREQMRSLNVAKVYEISDPSVAARPIELSEPQRPEAVVVRIEAATFTGRGDKVQTCE